MGQGYTVRFEARIKSPEEFIRLTNSFLDTPYIDRAALVDQFPSTIKECVSDILRVRQNTGILNPNQDTTVQFDEASGYIYVRNTFEASYGWEHTMYRWFKLVAVCLHASSDIFVVPSEGSLWHLCVDSDDGHVTEVAEGDTLDDSCRRQFSGQAYFTRITDNYEYGDESEDGDIGNPFTVAVNEHPYCMPCAPITPPTDSLSTTDDMTMLVPDSGFSEYSSELRTWQSAPLDQATCTLPTLEVVDRALGTLAHSPIDVGVDISTIATSHTDAGMYSGTTGFSDLTLRSDLISATTSAAREVEIDSDPPSPSGVWVVTQIDKHPANEGEYLLEVLTFSTKDMAKTYCDSIISEYTEVNPDNTPNWISETCCLLGDNWVINIQYKVIDAYAT